MLVDPNRERDLFQTAIERDRAEDHARRSWLHLLERRNAGKLLDKDFDYFVGARHLIKMYSWIDKIRYPAEFRPFSAGALERRSIDNDATVFQRLSLDIGAVNFASVARYNAQDALLFEPYPTPVRGQAERVLDFGAGHGRQANLFDRVFGKATYIGMDAIEAPYLVQRAYYRALGYELNDYIDDPAGFTLRDAPGVANHLPTWRFDLLPSGSIDYVIAVQVLRELQPHVHDQVLAEVHRCLKPRGRLYVRDHVKIHNPNQLDQEKRLEEAGFTLEWRAPYEDFAEIHGVPRIWRK